MNIDFEFLYQTNESVILLAFFVLLMVAGEIGFRRGRRAAANIDEKTSAQISVIEGSLLGVLALLLAFTMSMAVSRYEVRKQLVLDEANAIGTSWLRTQLLSAPDSTAIANLLRDYLNIRLQYSDSDEDLGHLQAARQRAQQLQTAFWDRTVGYNQKDPAPYRSGMLLQSLNQVIDLEASRWMAFFNHVPAAVIFVDAAVAWFAALLVGYAYGMEGKRQIFSRCLLAVVLTVVLSVIVDLDRPRQGFIHVSQQPMRDLQAQLNQAGNQ